MSIFTLLASQGDASGHAILHVLHLAAQWNRLPLTLTALIVIASAFTLAAQAAWRMRTSK
jgi:hypothetical protein